MFRCDEAREVDDVSFPNLFLEVCAEVFDELLEYGNVAEDFSSKMLDEVSNEVSGDLASERLCLSASWHHRRQVPPLGVSCS